MPGDAVKLTVPLLDGDLPRAWCGLIQLYQVANRWSHSTILSRAPRAFFTGKLLQKHLVLALRVPSHLSALLLRLNGSRLHLSPSLLNALGYYGPLSTRMRRLPLHVLSAILRKARASKSILWKLALLAKTSLESMSTAAQT